MPTSLALLESERGPLDAWKTRLGLRLAIWHNFYDSWPRMVS